MWCGVVCVCVLCDVSAWVRSQLEDIIFGRNLQPCKKGWPKEKTPQAEARAFYIKSGLNPKPMSIHTKVSKKKYADKQIIWREPIVKNLPLLQCDVLFLRTLVHDDACNTTSHIIVRRTRFFLPCAPTSRTLPSLQTLLAQTEGIWTSVTSLRTFPDAVMEVFMSDSKRPTSGVPTGSVGFPSWSTPQLGTTSGPRRSMLRRSFN